MKKEFRVTLNSLHDMMEFVRFEARKRGFSGKNLHEIEVAVEEAIVNIIRHSGCSETSLIEIDCCEPNEEGLKVVITDSGVPFNPLCKASKKVDIKLPIEQREPGGFGIFLIVKFMDNVEYIYEKNRNILTLTKLKKENK